MPAGTFRAIHIEQFRERRYSEDYWYAPEVRFTVKFQNSRGSRSELVSFKLLPAGR